jgi:hypothetical protein
MGLLDKCTSEDEKMSIRIEYWVLCGELVPVLEDTDRNKCVDYLQNRIKGTTQNHFLLSRYYNALYELTKNQKYCKEAINNSYSLFNYYISHEEPHYIKAYQELGFVFRMSRRIKADQTQIESDLVSLLKGDTVPDLTKYWILYAIKTNYNYCKYKSLSFAPDLCLDIFSRMEDYTWCKNFLEVGLFFANHFKTNNQSVFYEYLGDNEIKRINEEDNQENIVVAHTNQNVYLQMMKYYKKSGNNEKLVFATKKYNENKSSLKYITIENSQALTEKDRENINGLIEKMGKCRVEELFYFLSSDNRCIYPSHKSIVETWERAKNVNYFHMNYFSPVNNDINGNQQETSYESIYKFQFFQWWITNAFNLILKKILAFNIDNRRLTYSHVKQLLLQHTTFGMDIVAIRGQKEIKYTWFDRVDYAIKDYFKQFQNELKGKLSDWRLTINTLAIQFEGILRDFIREYSGETTKVKDGKKTVVAEMLLDDLIRTESFAEMFSEEDRDLFLYTFTNKGYNIRNNVAHGFYLPRDYTAFKATLVFLCILRLARFDNDFMNIIIADKTVSK